MEKSLFFPTKKQMMDKNKKEKDFNFKEVSLTTNLYKVNFKFNKLKISEYHMKFLANDPLNIQ